MKNIEPIVNGASPYLGFNSILKRGQLLGCVSRLK
jgi:hypothetical protein